MGRREWEERRQGEGGSQRWGGNEGRRGWEGD